MQYGQLVRTANLLANAKLANNRLSLETDQVTTIIIAPVHAQEQLATDTEHARAAQTTKEASMCKGQFVPYAQSTLFQLITLNECKDCRCH